MHSFLHRYCYMIGSHSSNQCWTREVLSRQQPPFPSFRPSEYSYGVTTPSPVLSLYGRSVSLTTKYLTASSTDCRLASVHRVRLAVFPVLRSTCEGPGLLRERPRTSLLPSDSSVIIEFSSDFVAIAVGKFPRWLVVSYKLHSQR